MVPLHLTNALYRNYVVLNLEQRKDLEAAIRLQKSSSMQENYELLFQLTTSEAFIQKALQINTAAISYGEQHENDTISSVPV